MFVKAVSKPVDSKNFVLDYDFDSINCVEIAKLIEKAGASAIAVHGRTVHKCMKDVLTGII